MINFFLKKDFLKNKIKHLLLDQCQDSRPTHPNKKDSLTQDSSHPRKKDSLTQDS